MSTDLTNSPQQESTLGMKIPLIVFLMGLLIFIIPFLTLMYEMVSVPENSKGNVGFGSLFIGFFLWPLGLALGIPSFIILIKRYVQR